MLELTTIVRTSTLSTSAGVVLMSETDRECALTFWALCGKEGLRACDDWPVVREVTKSGTEKRALFSISEVNLVW